MEVFLGQNDCKEALKWVLDALALSAHVESSSLRGLTTPSVSAVAGSKRFRFLLVEFSLYF